MDQNLKNYILELASECILYSEEALCRAANQFNNDSFFMLQAFYCAKKIEEIHYTKWQNIQLLNFYKQFHILNKEYLESMPWKKNPKNELPILNSLYEQLKAELSITQ